MARVRYIGPEPVAVPELGGRTIQPDEMVEVPDDRFEGYVCQPQTWEPIEEPRDWVWPQVEGEETTPAAAAVAPAPEPKAEAPKKPIPTAKATTSKEGN